MPYTSSLAPPRCALVRQERAAARHQLPLRRSSHLRGYAAERLVRPAPPLIASRLGLVHKPVHKSGE